MRVATEPSRDVSDPPSLGDGGWGRFVAIAAIAYGGICLSRYVEVTGLTQGLFTDLLMVAESASRAEFFASLLSLAGVAFALGAVGVAIGGLMVLRGHPNRWRWLFCAALILAVSHVWLVHHQVRWQSMVAGPGNVYRLALKRAVKVSPPLLPELVASIGLAAVAWRFHRFTQQRRDAQLRGFAVRGESEGHPASGGSDGTLRTPRGRVILPPRR